jgi:hypothetical protein
VVGAGLYASPINLCSLLEESNFLLMGVLISSASTSVKTTRKVIDLIDIDINIEDPLFVPKRGQTPLLLI